MAQKKNKKKTSARPEPRSGAVSYLRQPAVQVLLVLLAALAVYLIAFNGGTTAVEDTLAREVNVEIAYEMYQNGVFVVDVRTQEEWDDYHAPNTTLIPLDELPDRLSEVPQDQEVLVICRSGNRSQEGRDILLEAGYTATSMTGGLKEWYALGYPLEGAP